MNFAELLKSKLDAKLMSIEECAKAVDISRQQVDRHLRGKSLPSRQTMRRYRDVLGVSAEELIEAVANADVAPQGRPRKHQKDGDA